MLQHRIKLIYDYLHRGDNNNAIKQSTNVLLKLKSKKSIDKVNIDEQLVLALRGLAYARIGYYDDAIKDIDTVLLYKLYDEDVLAILWHYFMLCDVISNKKHKLEDLIEIFENNSNNCLLGENFQFDIISLNFWLRRYQSMQNYCNKLYSRYRKPIYLVYSSFALYCICKNEGQNIYNYQLINILVDKYLNECPFEYLDSNTEFPNNKSIKLSLQSRRIYSFVFLMKLYSLRELGKFEEYEDFLEKIQNNYKIFFPCITNEMILNLKICLIIKQYTLKNIDNNLSKDTNNEFLKSITQILLNSTTINNLKIDILRLFSYFFVSLTKYNMEILDNKEKYIDNCFNEFINNGYNLKSFLLYFNKINDICIYNLLDSLKGQILYLEIICQILLSLPINYGIFNHILEEINLIICNYLECYGNPIIDIRVALNYILKSKYATTFLRRIYLKKFLLKISNLKQLKCLNSELEWCYLTNILYLLSILNNSEDSDITSNCNVIDKDYLSFDDIYNLFNDILDIEINILNSNNYSRYGSFLISLVLYCLSIPLFKNDNRILIFSLTILQYSYNINKNGINNHISIYLLSEILPYIGCYNLCNKIINNYLSLKRSQLMTLNIQGTIFQLISCPYIYYIDSSGKNCRNRINKINYNQNFDYPLKIRMIIDIHNETCRNLRDSSIESLRNNCHSFFNSILTLQTENIIQEKDIYYDILYGFDFLNKFLHKLLSCKFLNNDLQDFVSYHINQLKNILNKQVFDILSNSNIINQDLSPIFSSVSAFIEVIPKFENEINSLLPCNYFEITDSFCFEDHNSLLKNIIQGGTITQYIAYHRLQIFIIPILIINDFIFIKDIPEFNNIYNFINKYKSLEFIKLNTIIQNEFIIILLNDIISPLIIKFTDIIKYKINYQKNIQSEIYDLISISEKLYNLINIHIIDHFLNTGNQYSNLLSYFNIQTMLENILCVIFGPLNISLIIYFWIMSNLSKKDQQYCKPFINIQSNIIKLILENLETFISIFSGSVELSSEFDTFELISLKSKILSDRYNKQELILSVKSLTEYQSNTIHYSVKSLKYILDCIKSK
ncbi:uncharacterized protein CMU_016080 [Cryptosporidium muris RN66]|uniref:TPR repeat-containing protein n=1 Tax=Cryptosporidium muris (strain RN66) TaxID=441375 RepID=B6ACK5_CRYMR|nr:uncharacterized protein CMU_016080 [Cryptosporidium muris RN66]EEA05859.1 hypothetical protein, conserved [Cryptosporidium muris RN66]|eukprot:XP_002140208.1 hypothetical protein [Cryptosporidium muris RN66]